MSHKHIVEQLIEADKKLLGVCNRMENETSEKIKIQTWIDDLNDVIRKLDHILI